MHLRVYSEGGISTTNLSSEMYPTSIIRRRARGFFRSDLTDKYERERRRTDGQISKMEGSETKATGNAAFSQWDDSRREHFKELF